MSGKAHLPYLVVSLHTLRKHWTGPISVFAWGESFETAKQIANDRNLDVAVYLRPTKYAHSKNGQFLDKIDLMTQLATSSNPDQRYLYLDADTMPVGDLRGLMEGRPDSELLLTTRFNHWVVAGSVIRNRIQRLLSLDAPLFLDGTKEQAPSMSAFAHMLLHEDNANFPSVNGGVFSIRGGMATANLLSLWKQWTLQAHEAGVFIPDETALHPLAFMHHGRGEVGVSPPGYNVSPKYCGDPALYPQGVFLWHFHGDSNVRPKKSAYGFQLWWTPFLECLDKNVGDMKHWFRSTMNKWIQLAYAETNIRILEAKSEEYRVLGLLGDGD